MKNIDKWNIYLSALYMQLAGYLLKEQIYFEDKFYKVSSTGEITAYEIERFDYDFDIDYPVGNVSNAKVIQIKKLSESKIDFKKDSILIRYQPLPDKNCTNITRWERFKADNNITSNHIAAKMISKRKRLEIDAKLAFQSANTKDADYDYETNGYTFLGWQNSWEFTTVDGHMVAKDQPKHNDCINAKHTLISVSCNDKGSENVESCPICKIYWKYDSSD